MVKFRDRDIARINPAMAESFHNGIFRGKTINLPEVAKSLGLFWEDVAHDLRYDTPLRAQVKRAFDELRWEVAHMAYLGGTARKLRENIPTAANLRYAIELLNSDALLGKIEGEGEEKKERQVNAEDLDL